MWILACIPAPDETGHESGIPDDTAVPACVDLDLQGAIDAAPEGGTILVCAGTLPANVVVGRHLTIRGAAENSGWNALRSRRAKRVKGAASTSMGAD